jgi:hypothetical protein
MSFVIAVIMSEPVVSAVDRHIKNDWILSLVGRLRTWILAWGTVSFWRLVWDIWDQFLGKKDEFGTLFEGLSGLLTSVHPLQITYSVRSGGTSSLSAGLGHVIPLVVLPVTGCVSSIVAPASTMGVDAVPHEDAADEPLFAVSPVPYEVLYFLGITRQPTIDKAFLSIAKSDGRIEMGTIQIKSDLSTDIIIPEDKKRLPGRDEESGGLEAVVEMVETQTTGAADRALKSAAELEDSRIRGTLPPHLSVSSRRGWQSDGSFRSYSDLQRFGLVRIKSEYSMRSSPDNKRNRSKFFRSR